MKSVTKTSVWILLLGVALMCYPQETSTWGIGLFSGVSDQVGTPTERWEQYMPDTIHYREHFGAYFQLRVIDGIFLQTELKFQLGMQYQPIEIEAENQENDPIQYIGPGMDSRRFFHVITFINGKYEVSLFYFKAGLGYHWNWKVALAKFSMGLNIPVTDTDKLPQGKMSMGLFIQPVIGSNENKYPTAIGVSMGTNISF